MKTRIGLSLAIIWVVAGAIIFLARAVKPTPASVAAYLQPSQLAGKSPSARARIIDKGASLLNRLTYDQRQDLQRERVSASFFKALTPEEQQRFLEQTLPVGFKQMMEMFNKMDPAKRKQFVNRALEEMRKHEGEAPPPNLEDKNVQLIINQGLRSFYSDASAEVKLDMAPLIEQMQKGAMAR